MALFAGIAGLISIVVGWLVASRLFALSRRTGANPERLLATAFTGLFGVGYPLAAISRAPGLVETIEGSLLYALGTIGMVVGAMAFARFPQVVFRPNRLWAAVFATFVGVAAAIAGLGCAVSVASAETLEEMIVAIQPWAIGLMISVGLPFLWNAIESSLYYRSMKRRMPLGLAQPATTHRFLLWALASWSAVLQIGAVTAIRAAGFPVLAPLPMTIIACCSLFNSGCWALAFFMPDCYRTKILREVGDETLDELSAPR